MHVIQTLLGVSNIKGTTVGKGQRKSGRQTHVIQEDLWQTFVCYHLQSHVCSFHQSQAGETREWKVKLGRVGCGPL